ncbi:MAG: 50S ribosomal protein L9 [Proteobacteria bacterium]|nr:50S ribosomal protein L9 [Pseudomonadota bacterium]
MEVILQEDVHSLGKSGEIVKVSAGYARNYLIPRGLAMLATTRNVKVLEHQKRMVTQKIKKQEKKAQTTKETLEALSLTIRKKAGEQDKLFGAVTAMDIEEAIAKEGYAVDRRRIDLKEPIKNLGVYVVPVKLHPEVIAQVKVWVVNE